MLKYGLFPTRPSSCCFLYCGRGSSTPLSHFGLTMSRKKLIKKIKLASEIWHTARYLTIFDVIRSQFQLEMRLSAHNGKRCHLCVMLIWFAFHKKLVEPISIKLFLHITQSRKKAFNNINLSSVILIPNYGYYKLLILFIFQKKTDCCHSQRFLQVEYIYYQFYKKV